MKASIRHLTLDNIVEVLALERLAWPDDVQASEEQLRDRLGTFAEGFLGAFVEEGLAGMASSQVLQFSHADAGRSWKDLTADGWISRTHQPGGDCLYFVSICVHPHARGRGIGSSLNRGRLDLCKRLGLPLALTNTRLPNLGRYLQVNTYATPGDYVDGIVAGRIREPVVNMYLGLGFRPLRLIPQCMESDRESANYGLAMLKQLDEDRS